jgi:hypothetical protein
MKVNKYEILSLDKDKIYTEILFSLATSKAGNIEFAVFTVKEALACEYCEKHLKSLKQSQKIDFYIKSSDIESSTAGSYLLNKYPEAVSEIQNGDFSFIVKL